MYHCPILINFSFPLSQQEKQEREEEERKKRLQLYVFILRCISYPFNAKQPTDMTKRQIKVSKHQLDVIQGRFQVLCLCAPVHTPLPGSSKPPCVTTGGRECGASEVVPVNKKGSRSEAANCRPVSLLSISGCWRRQLLYKAQILSSLEYSCLAWGGAASSHLALLDRVQQQAERIIRDGLPEQQAGLHSLPHRRDMASLTTLYKEGTGEADDGGFLLKSFEWRLAAGAATSSATSFLKGELQIAADEAFINAVQSYYEIFLKNERLASMVTSGACSQHDLREVFKHNVEKRVRSLPEIDGLSKETVLTSWMAKFDMIIKGLVKPHCGCETRAASQTRLRALRWQGEQVLSASMSSTALAAASSLYLSFSPLFL
ncbi:Calcium-dependent secretion activator [Chionoecetes opilio]|uniref:Calcium-dependent secretion activator n=1 Tax=Chionoecetes opilio TaxID=41210 RepID=A0A8J4YN94_CHIOP|nr:Calcium-dependent secretion activator [Chionoecetes opilio]